MNKDQLHEGEHFYHNDEYSGWISNNDFNISYLESYETYEYNDNLRPILKSKVHDRFNVDKNFLI